MAGGLWPRQSQPEAWRNHSYSAATGSEATKLSGFSSGILPSAKKVSAGLGRQTTSTTPYRVTPGLASARTCSGSLPAPSAPCAPRGGSDRRRFIRQIADYLEPQRRRVFRCSPAIPSNCPFLLLEGLGRFTAMAAGVRLALSSRQPRRPAAAGALRPKQRRGPLRSLVVEGCPGKRFTGHHWRADRVVTAGQQLQGQPGASWRSAGRWVAPFLVADQLSWLIWLCRPALHPAQFPRQRRCALPARAFLALPTIPLRFPCSDWRTGSYLSLGACVGTFQIRPQTENRHPCMSDPLAQLGSTNVRSRAPGGRAHPDGSRDPRFG